WTSTGPTDPGILYPPVGAGLAPLPNGFAPKAKVVFLASCGIDANFLAQWHLGAGQALIVPKYRDDNKSLDITLNTAAVEWQRMLQVLGTGGTVDAAVAAGNEQAAADKSDYTWMVAPGGDGSVSFKAKAAK